VLGAHPRASKNPGEAARLFRMSANSGFVDAQFNLGLCLERGYDLPVNRAEAKEWYLKAAKQGDADAQYRYAHMLEVDKQENDYKSMISCYKKSAKSGNWDAIVALGRCSAQGIGTARDDQAAQAYWAKSLEHQDPRPKRYFAVQKTRLVFLDYLKTRMQPPTFHKGNWASAVRNPNAPERQIWKGYGLIADDDLIQVVSLPYVYNLDLTNMDITDGGVDTLRGGHIKSLFLLGALSDSVISKIAGLPHLLNLTIYGEIKSDNIRRFQRSKLQSINLATGEVNDATISAISEIKSLRSFTFGSDEPLSLESLRKVASLSKMEELSFSIDRLSDETIVEFNRMRNLRSLTLTLTSPDLRDSDLTIIKRLSCPEISLTVPNSTHISVKGVEMLLALPAISDVELDEAPIAKALVESLEEKYPEKSLTVFEDGDTTLSKRVEARKKMKPEIYKQSVDLFTQ